MRRNTFFHILYCGCVFTACHAPQKSDATIHSVKLNDIVENLIPPIPDIKTKKGLYSNSRLGNYFVAGTTDSSGLKIGFWQISDPSNGHLFKGDFFNNDKNDWWEITCNKKLIACGRYGLNRKQGFWRIIPPSGTTKLFVYFQNDTLTDLALEFLNDSVLLTEGKYLKGLKDNYWKYYHRDGTIKEQGYFCSGLKNGWWQKFNQNGNLEEEASYSMGEIAGYVKRYENGILIEEGKQINGIKKGAWKSYSTDGRLKNIKEYDD